MKIKCPDCDKSYDSLLSTSIHYRKTHQKSSKDFYVAHFLFGIEPTCKCGCGGAVKYLDITRGFSEYQQGHASRVNNNWGHNQEALLKSQTIRRENWNNGVYVPWSKGLTKETDERVAESGRKASKTINNNQEECLARSERMKRNRMDGTIPTLCKEQHSQWQGGISPLNHFCHANRRLYNDWKYPKLLMANFKCSICDNSRGLEVHHDGETFSEILRKIASAFCWSDNLATSLEKDNQELIALKDKISDAVAEYHIKNNISGIVLCESCHKNQHDKLNF